MVTIEQLRGETYMGGNPVVEAMYEDNRAHLGEILELTRRQRLVPFIGSGFSAGLYHSWNDMLLEFTSRVSPTIRNEIASLLGRADFEGAASLLQEEMGARGRGRRDVFLRAIDGEFGERTVEDAFAEMSAERRGIPRAFRGPILTTNYDLLIERAYREAGEDIEVAYPHVSYHRSRVERLLRSTGPSLFKLHGDVRDPDKIVITREDYDEAYGADGGGSELTRFMGSVFEGRDAVLFLGCSLGSDRTMDVLDRSAPDHVYYALVGLPEGTENAGDPFSPNLVLGGKLEPGYREMSRRLAGMNVRPIWYPHGQHDALDALLGWLEGELDPVSASTSVSPVSIPDSTYGEPVGREREIGEVVELLSNKSSITLVTGPVGIGKTEVCREALRRLRDSGRDVVYAVTVGASTAWAQCDAVAKALGVPGIEQREGVRAADYARYLTDKLANLERPVVYLDNWEDAWVASDEEGRRELVALLRALRDGGSSVLASSREAAADYETGARTIRVHELGRKPSVDLFRRVLEAKGGGPDPSGPEFEELIGNLEGHPLAIVLTATLAVSSPSWDDVLIRWAGASQHAEDPRYESLETALRLSWNAVAGATLAHELWGVMALTPGDLPRSELDALAGLIESGPCDWLPAYARLRDASLMSASGDGSLSMLRPVREAFFSLASDDIVDRCLSLLTKRLVRIFEDDDNGSGVLGTGAGDARAHALASLPRALFLLGRSLGLRGLGAGAPTLARVLGNHCQFDWEASRPVLDALLRVARDAGDDGLAALAAQASAECAMHQDRLGDAGPLLDEAERLHREAGDDLGAAYDLLLCARLAMRLDRLDEAGPLLEEAERLHRSAGDGFGAANDLHYRAELAMRQGRLGDAESLLEEAEGLHREAGDALGTANDLQARAQLAMRQGRLGDAESLLEEAEGLHREAGDSLGTANDLSIRARLAMRLGRLDEAGCLLEEAERLHRKAGDGLGEANDLRARAELAMRLGRLDEAGPLLEGAERLHRGAGDGLGTANDLLLRGQLAVRLGDHAEAAELFQDAERLHRKVGDDLGAANDLSVRAELVMRLGDLDSAGALIDEAVHLHRKVGDDIGVADDLRVRAELAIRDGDLGGAGPLLDEAERLHRKVGDDLGAANDLSARARLAIRAGDLGGAGPLLDEAERLHRKVGDDLGAANDLSSRARIAMLWDYRGEAERYFEEAERLYRRVGDGLGMANFLSFRARIAMHRGALEDAEELLGGAARLHRRAGDNLGTANDLTAQAELRIRQGSLEEGEELLNVAKALHRQAGDDLGEKNNLYVRALLLALRGDFDTALQKLAVIEEVHERIGGGLILRNIREMRDLILHLKSEGHDFNSNSSSTPLQLDLDLVRSSQGAVELLMN